MNEFEAYGRLREIAKQLERPWRRRGLPETLTAAAMAGDLDSMQLFLDHGEEIDEETRGYGSPLQAAAVAGNLEAVRWLLERGADPNKRKTISPLESAQHWGHADIFEALLEAGARSSPETMLRFENASASPEAPAPPSEENQLLRQEALEVVRCLGDRIDKLNKYGESLLAVFIHEGQTEIALGLLAQGADPNAGTPDSNARPLHEAIGEGEWEVFQDLLERGADVNAEIHLGITPLMAAAGFGRLDIVEKLLELGADPSRRTRGGQTAVDQAKGPHRKAIQKVVRQALRGKKIASQGLKVEGKARTAGVAARRGASDFLAWMVEGEPDWCLLAVRKDIEEVTPALAEIRSAARMETNMARRTVETDERESFVLQLRDHEWTLEIRSIFWIESEASRVDAQAAELSRRLDTDAVSFVGSDTGGTCHLTHFSKAEPGARMDVDLDGAIDGGNLEDLLRDLELYLPPCHMARPFGNAQLVLQGIGAKAVARLDCLVFERA